MQKRHKQVLAAPALAISLIVGGAFLLTACGGGESSSQAEIPTDRPVVSGTAAYGAPLAGATVTLTDANGVTKTTTAAADGSYWLDVSGLSAPFLVTASAQTGDEVKSFSALVVEAPAKGQVANVNVTPLTTAIVALASSTGSNPEQFSDPTLLKSLDTAKLKKAEDAIKAIIADVAKDAGLPANFDPVKSPFQATLGAPADKLLETVKVAVTETGVTVTNALAPIATSDTEAKATITIKDVNTAPPVVALPKPTVTTMYNDLLTSLRAQLNACLALDPADRVTLDANNNPTALKNACSTGALTAVAVDYKVNGYDFLGRWGARFRDLPKGAQVGQAEIQATFAQTGGGTTLSFRFPIKAENGGLFYGDTLRAGSDGAWKFSGNQRKYDMGMSARMYRFIDKSTYPRIGKSYGPDGGKTVGYLSRYESALSFSFNPTGPNAANVYAVKITGPGLPNEGLVLARSSVCGNGDSMTIYSANGTLPDASGKTAAFTATESSTPTWRYDVQPIGNGYKGTDFWNELRGFAAPTRDSSGNVIAYNPVSAGPAQAGSTPPTYPVNRYSTPIPELPKFTWEVYSVGGATPEIFSMTLLDKPISPAAADAFQWTTPSDDTLKYLDASASNPLATFLDKATLSWTTPNGAPLVTWAGLSGNSRDQNGSTVRFNTGENIRPVGGKVMVVAPVQETDGLGNACAKTQIPPHSATTGSRNIQFNQTANRITMAGNFFHNGNTAAPVVDYSQSLGLTAFNADTHPLQSGSVVLGDGKLAQFSLSTSTSTNPVYMNVASVSNGILSLDTTQAAQTAPVLSMYNLNFTAVNGYPKLGTLLARVGGNTSTTQRVIDLRGDMVNADGSAGHSALFTIMNNTTVGAGGYIQFYATPKGATNASYIKSATFDTSQNHVYQIVVSVWDASGAGLVRVYLDGGSTPILDQEVSHFTSVSGNQNSVRFGQLYYGTNLAYKSTLDWLIWAPGAYQPADLKGKLPSGLGFTTGY